MLLTLPFLVGLLLSWPSALAAATESSRTQTTLSLDNNTVTAETNIKYIGYAPGESIPVAVEYWASCNVVFRGLSLSKQVPFSPLREVTGTLTNVRGTPLPEQAAPTSTVTFELRFATLGAKPSGTQWALTRLDLLLGVDTDCDLATGDLDGVDRTVTLRLQIWVTTGSYENE